MNIFSLFRVACLDNPSTEVVAPINVSLGELTLAFSYSSGCLFLQSMPSSVFRGLVLSDKFLSWKVLEVRQSSVG